MQLLKQSQIMKQAFVPVFILFCFNTYSQDSLKIRQIDAFVSKINSSNLPIQRDTLVQDRPELGLKMTTYLSGISNDSELIKYVNYVTGTMIENGVTRQMTSSNTFYFEHNKLIKVEEYSIEGDKKGEANWYYSDDKPIHWTFQSEKSEERANLLLNMSKAMVSKIIK